MSVFMWANLLSAQEDSTMYDLSIEDVMNFAQDKASVLGIPHPHPKNESMLEYSYMNMVMKNNLTGRDEISVFDVLNQGFTMTPKDMTMQMHMFMAMHAISDHVTLNLMVPYWILDMNIRMRMPTGMERDFNTRTQALGDTEFSVFYTAYNKDIHSVQADMGVSIPTGSIELKDITPMSQGEEIKLPYPMQSSSGTLDPKLGITYLGSTLKASWGLDIGTTLRLYDNKNDYHLGNRYHIVAGGAYNWAKWIATSFRLDAKSWDNISGADPDFMPMMAPTARTDLRAGKRIDASVGLSFNGTKGFLKKNSIVIDYRLPIYQDLDGPQLETSRHFVISWIFVSGANLLH